MIKHMIKNPFITATGAAAFVHSTWALGTLFAGNEPTQFTGAWLAWVLPAALIAFSLDIGQIATSNEIREGQRGWQKYATFVVFAVATYYLQWLYIAHHMPMIDLAPGVRESWSGAASLFRDAAVWLLPALLPMSTTLYTLSHMRKETREPDAALPEPTPEPTRSRRRNWSVIMMNAPKNRVGRSLEMLPATVEEASEPDAALPAAVLYTCTCGFSKEYPTPNAAAQAKRAHERSHKVKHDSTV